MMRRALDEARRGLGRTHPNPAVGCVIARGDEIIAVGYHARAGLAHAEAAALTRAGERARGADLYVTLEPCDHQGRTGPCSHAIIAAGVRRVFVGASDPNPIVSGRGVRRLRRAGIEVHRGIEVDACRALNEAYEHSIRHGRPFVVAKMAMSLDGKVATSTGDSQWVTGAAARRYGHRLRNELDAICVGVGTVLADDPRLSCRLRGGRDPVRIIVDTQARTPTQSTVLALARATQVPSYLAVSATAPVRRLRALERAGATIWPLPTSGGHVDLVALLRRIAEEGLRSMLLEGGPRLLGGFFDSGLVDKLFTFVAPLVIGGEAARSAVAGQGAVTLGQAMRLRWQTVEPVGADWLLVGYPRRHSR
ncbi:MAG: bifunctional diaminohydroxyphosphoribosylaminopyrimidine deaminase/5-amino-6-(5-phosphoribosylamino)uracil reductase RibD [Myxococcota bacterium]